MELQSHGTLYVKEGDRIFFPVSTLTEKNFLMMMRQEIKIQGISKLFQIL
jgi:hypothetical protein